jgi:hypothetical protein
MSSSITVDPGCATLSQAIGSKARTGVTAKNAVRVFLWSLLAVAYFAFFLPQRPAIYDEGVVACGAERILHGQLPYLDFDTGYPPAEFYTIAGVFRLFGATLLAVRLWDTLWRLAILAAAFVLAKAASSNARVSPVPLVCGGVLTGAIGFHLYPMISGTLPCMVALWCAVLYLQRRDLRWLFASGALAGAGILYRHDLALCICAAITVAVCYQAIADHNRRWLRIPAVFGAGVLLVVVPAALWLWSSVPEASLVRAFIDYPRTNMAARRLPLPGPGSLPAWEVLYLPISIILAGASALKRIATAQRPIFIMLLITAGATLALATQRLDPPHAYPAVMFSLVLLCIYLAELPTRAVLPTLLKAVAVACYGLLSVIALHTATAEADESRQDWVGQPVVSRHPASGRNDVARAWPVRLSSDERQAIEYIDSHLSPGQPLYVGITRHSLQFLNDALFYFLADRPQATRYDAFIPGSTNSAAVQQEIGGALHQRRVEYVVLFCAPVSTEPNLSSADNGITILDDAIRLEYSEVARFGSYIICRRRGSFARPG